MFKWRSEKRRIKAVFKLQFQATQVPQMKGKKSLMISLVPEDIGKPTVRLEKAAILNGTCSWENPIYETVKLLKESKKETFNEKIYYFIVSTGSSKKGHLGEVYINFADFVEATKPSTVALLLTSSNSGPILHVTIQRMQETVDQRDFEEIESPMAKSQDGSLKNQMENYDRDEDGNHSFAEDERFDKITPHNAELNGSSRGLQLENGTDRRDPTTLRRNSMPPKRTVDAIPTEHRHEHRRSNTDWSISSMSEGSIADSTNSPEENNSSNRLEEASDRQTEKLKSEVSILERQAEVSEMELQTLRKQIVKESKRGQDLSRQIISLKEEKDALKTECEQLKSSRKYDDEQMESENLKVLEEIMQELNHEKDCNTTLRLQLQKTEDSNSELILAVRDLDEMLEEKNREISDLSSFIRESQSIEETHSQELDLLNQKMTGLYGEIEVNKKDREELKMEMEQLIVDYEILKQQNYDISSNLQQSQIQKMDMQNECSESSATIKAFKIQVERLEKEIDNRALELSEASASINELATQVKRLEKELEKQARGFEDDLEAMTLAKVEQEQRAIRAEEALRKTRSNNANAAERLQEDFRRISAEMEAKFDENEKLTAEAVTEANDLRLQKRVLEEMLQKADDELVSIKHQCELKDQELLGQTGLRAKQIEQMSLELNEKCMQVNNLEKREEEMRETFATEIQQLKGEIQMLKTEKNGFSEKSRQKGNLRHEMEQLKKANGDQEKVERLSKERGKLEREFASLRKKAEKLEKESNMLRSLKDEKDTMVGVLQSEVKMLKANHEELKQQLFAVKSEKENLRKEVFELECNLRTKEEEQTELKKAAPEKSANSLVRENDRRNRSEEMESKMKSGDHTRSAYSEKELEVSTLCTSDDSTKLFSEVALLKERNKDMERELKEMEERYSAISLKFAEVEGERQQLVMTVRNLKNGKKN